MNDTGAISGQARPLHVLNRLAFGPRPGDVERVRQFGAERYIHEQLYPDAEVPIPESLRRKIAGYHTLHMSPLELFRTFQLPVMEVRRADKGASNEVLKSDLKDARIRQRIVLQEAIEARVARAIEGPRQLQEMLTAFWFNHFNVFRGKGLDSIWTGSFEQTAIRPHTMGKFRALLGATAMHPAMLFYLDNWQNTAPGSPGAKGRFEGINENYAREVMELHTLGVNGGYTQADVIALAHILTGWGIAPGKPNAMMREEMRRPMTRLRRGFYWRNANRMPPPSPSLFYFDPRRHDFSSKVFLGRTIHGAGISEGERALDILARHPATAKHLSFELARFFVTDNPPDSLIGPMAARYLASGGDIREVLAVMFAAPEFWQRRYYRSKFKSPYEYVISCARATGVEVRNYRPLYGTMQLLGQPLYGCLTPNGYSNTEDAWLNPDGMMMRLSFATALGNGNLPLDRPPFEEQAGEAAIGGRGARTDARRGAMNAKFAAPERPHPGPKPKMVPPDAVALTQTLGAGALGANTAQAVESAPPRLRTALILGSPEFMTR
ncbi:MAG TPA: DUF1800 domain-containing protein [Candidatus Binataceae bacterium]|nr:DUF1800 domain-containing protein [Candidatus Binataceae bacterium]